MQRAMSDTRDMFIQRVGDWLEQLGYEVYETPANSCADLIAENSEDRIVIVCPFSQNMVTPAALQRALQGEITFRGSMKMSISNMPFTEQAKAFADDNKIITMGGNELHNFFDLFQRKVKVALLPAETGGHGRSKDYWIISDMEQRYKLDGETIINDIIPEGLPCYMIGSEYRFNCDDVENWELEKRHLRYGHDLNYLKLPYVTEYRKKLEKSLIKAKKAGNTKKVKRIRLAARENGIILSRDRPLILAGAGIAAIALITVAILLMQSI